MFLLKIVKNSHFDETNQQDTSFFRIFLECFCNQLSNHCNVVSTDDEQHNAARNIQNMYKIDR